MGGSASAFPDGRTELVLRRGGPLSAAPVLQGITVARPASLWLALWVIECGASEPPGQGLHSRRQCHRCRVCSCMDACSLPQATCHLTIVPSWFYSWREVDLRSLKGNPDEENEEVMAWSLSLRERVHVWVQTSRASDL